MERVNQHFVTNIYQAPLINAIQSVLLTINTDEPLAAWQTLRSLYHIIPPDSKKTLTTHYENIQRNLAHLSRKNLVADPLLTNLNQHAEFNHYLQEKNLFLLSKIIETLFNDGYLEKPSIKPRFGEDKRLE